MWDFFFFLFGLIFSLFFPKARVGNVSVPGIKAHLNVPAAFAPRRCEAALLLTAGLGVEQNRGHCLPAAPPSSCRAGSRGPGGFGLLMYTYRLGRNFNFSSTTKEDIGACLVSDT